MADEQDEMVVLVAKRAYAEELVEVGTASMPQAQAEEILARLGTYETLLLDRDSPGQQGELRIEIESADRGTILSDPVRFLPEAAHAALVLSGMPAEQATWVLSATYAHQWLASYYEEAGMPQRADRIRWMYRRT